MTVVQTGKGYLTDFAAGERRVDCNSAIKVCIQESIKPPLQVAEEGISFTAKTNYKQKVSLMILAVSAALMEVLSIFM